MAPQNEIRAIDTREQAKARAKTLRAELHARGQTISHSASLERVAQEQGVRDWNTLCAILPASARVDLSVGDQVDGQYLKQQFSGTVIAVQRLSREGDLRVSIDLDVPVDVVSFESFSSRRRRITGIVSSSGVSARKTSDGVPHLIISGTISTAS